MTRTEIPSATGAGKTDMTNANRPSAVPATAVLINQPYSEVCCHMKVAGKPMWVEPVASGMRNCTTLRAVSSASRSRAAKLVCGTRQATPDPLSWRVPELY